ncbi:response regulator transcription factor [Micromonospora sp. R77]|uniref:response regulator transcription factor n=1 Tax=Micromonospora sp. R77 TaxID=2925836 RepID=UPI001F6170A8|nr:response regulator transcription factor [Micromonospora sp. R77]MCI4061432.1 response regulator transcription factor [Micromonospora sp. R77]
MPLVLIVEDDPSVRRALTLALTKADYLVQPATTAMEALTLTMSVKPSVIVLDLGLPDMDGADALVMIRAVSSVPVIVATARRAEHDIVRLLNAGADDYVTKPFSAAQLLARIAAVLRRGGSGTPRRDLDPPLSEIVAVGPLRIDPNTRSVLFHGSPMTLTRKEFELLRYLAERADRVITREELYLSIWKQPLMRGDQTLATHTSILRRKLGESAARPGMLRTIRGVGLMLTSSP